MIHFVIPALNERENLSRLGDTLRAAADGLDEPCRVVLVDDGSTDGTGEAAPEAVRPLEIEVVRHPENRGVRAAFLSGFSAALEHGAEGDLIVTLEADNTSDIAELNRLVGAARDGADLVLGSCYAPGGGVEGTNAYRHLLSACANTLIKVWFGFRGLHTFSSFYRVHRLEALQRVFDLSDGEPMREAGFASVVELLARFHIHGMKIVEVPVVLRSSHRLGKSKMRVGRTIRGYFRIMGLLGLRGSKVRRGPRDG